jgi:hypothetical protein
MTFGPSDVDNPLPPELRPPRRRERAIPARIHVFLIFMIQFIAAIAILGGAVPTLHRSGWHPVLLALFAAAALLALHFGIEVIGQAMPVRCTRCGSASRFRGFRWWPFTYRYACPRCGAEARYAVAG